MYYSACGQDQWVLETLQFKTNGFFVDLGAGNGVDYNNTYTLESEYNWDGICVENTQQHFIDLSNNRNCSKYNFSINNFDGQCYIDDEGKVVETGTTLVNCKKFNSLMSINGYSGTIDYLSVNVGNIQKRIIDDIDFDTYDITLISIQNNIYRSNFIGSDDDIFLFLKEKGYERMKFNVASYDENFIKKYQPIEDFYYKLSFLYPELY
jgi:hypothetical protein